MSPTRDFRPVTGPGVTCISVIPNLVNYCEMILYSTEIAVMFGWELTEDFILNLADLFELWTEADSPEKLKISSKCDDESTGSESEDTRYDRTMSLLHPWTENRKKIDGAFQRAVQILLSQDAQKEDGERFEGSQRTSESESKRKKKRPENPDDHDQQNNLEFIVLTARCNDEEPIHRCFVVLRDRTMKWTPPNPFCNVVVPLNCSPVPALSIRVLNLIAEGLQLSTTEVEPSWMMCAAMGYST